MMVSCLIYKELLSRTPGQKCYDVTRWLLLPITPLRRIESVLGVHYEAAAKIPPFHKAALPSLGSETKGTFALAISP